MRIKLKIKNKKRFLMVQTSNPDTQNHKFTDFNQPQKKKKKVKEPG